MRDTSYIAIPVADLLPLDTCDKLAGELFPKIDLAHLTASKRHSEDPQQPNSNEYRDVALYSKTLRVHGH